MNRKDGISRTERLKENASLTPFAVIDSDKAPLLRQSLDLARFIHFYNDRNEPDGYFDQLLDQIRAISSPEDPTKAPDFNKKMEPSQALLFTFIENLHHTGQLFNDRWSNFTAWYLEEYLKIKPLPIEADKIWLQFKKNVPGNVTLEKGTRFSVKDKNNEPVYYSLESDLVVNDITVNSVHSLYFEKDKNRLPAAGLNFVTTVRIKDLIARPGTDGEMMFGRNQDTTLSREPGLIITSPALLLREGSRRVSVTLTCEDQKWTYQLNSVIDHLKKHYTGVGKEPKQEYGDFLELEKRYLELSAHHRSHRSHFRKIASGMKQKSQDHDRLFEQYDYKSGSDEALLREVLRNIFYLSVTTVEGWKSIAGSTVKRGKKNSLVIDFTLPDEFLPTCAPGLEIHGFESAYPALKIVLNFDASLYAFSWLKDFTIARVKIITAVKGVGNLQVYNELGRVDNSKPFVPFGINTTKGSWMAVGNYEMSRKHTQSVDLRIQWNQLPETPTGLQGYYSGYQQGITNQSFRVDASYLTNYNWFNAVSDRPLYLFDSENAAGGIPAPDKKLVETTRFRNIEVKGMMPFKADEEAYEYTINARSGFVKLTLAAPSMGFGEETYRRIFTEQMMENSRRKKKYPTIQPPISPIIEKITLNYESEDTIDLRNPDRRDGSAVYQVSPLGSTLAVNKNLNRSVPFVFSMDTDANLLVALGNVKGGEHFSMYLDFSVVSNDFFGDSVPAIHMYWGNGYYWQSVPEGVVISDDTDKMLVSGCIVMRFPEDLPPSLFDSDGQLWLRAGISAHENHIPQLAGLYTNVGMISLNIDRSHEGDQWEIFKTLNGELTPEKNLPGITSFKRITNFYEGREKENTLDMQMRISEFVTHRERAVTPRDFERIALQRFPDLGKVKCLPGFKPAEGDANSVTIAVIPHPLQDADYSKPVVTSAAINQIENYLEKRCTAYVSEVNVVNPVYEELMVKCIIRVKRENHLALFGTVVKQVLDEAIAPWRKIPLTPSFGQTIRLDDLYTKLLDLDFTQSVEHLSVIYVSEIRRESDYDNRFRLFVYEKEDKKARKSAGHQQEKQPVIIVPAQPHTIFIPAEEHLIELLGVPKKQTTKKFGLGGMKVGKTFIIGK